VQAVSGLEPGKPRRITLSTARSGGEVVLRVRDSGPGVPKDLVPYLFTPFFTTKAPGEGTGLGLSLSYGLVKAHEGLLEYEGPPQGGAEFKVTLPLFQSDPSPIMTTQAINGQGPARRILVVDEDPAVHRVLSALFTPEGYAVEAARTGEQGLKLARERNYDLIITDARVVAGATTLFAGALLDALPQARGRLLVACAGEEQLPAPLAGAPLHRVTKPFNLRDLRTVANEILQ
jgi:CheY-like chemotaxis protein